MRQEKPVYYCEECGQPLIEREIAGFNIKTGKPKMAYACATAIKEEKEWVRKRPEREEANRQSLYPMPSFKKPTWHTRYYIPEDD